MSSEARRITDLIKKRGYWEVDVRPIEVKKSRFESIADCMKKVEESVVKLRGWPYPVYLDSTNPYPMPGRIEGTVDFGAEKEFWTMFLSGHFYHLFAVREDWLEEANIVFRQPKYMDFSAGKSKGLDFLMTLYTVTEIFEFATRLTQKQIFGRGLKIKVKLHGMEGRQLFSFDITRWIRPGYISKATDIPFEEQVTSEELIAQGHKMALDKVVGIFQIFGWMNINMDVLKDEQKKLLEKRF